MWKTTSLALSECSKVLLLRAFEITIIPFLFCLFKLHKNFSVEKTICDNLTVTTRLQEVTVPRRGIKPQTDVRTPCFLCGLNKQYRAHGIWVKVMIMNRSVSGSRLAKDFCWMSLPFFPWPYFLWRLCCRYLKKGLKTLSSSHKSPNKQGPKWKSIFPDVSDPPFETTLLPASWLLSYWRNSDV